MWLYLSPPGIVRAIVSDEFTYEFTSDQQFRVVQVGEDLQCWMMVAIFQPLNEYQMVLF